MKWTVKCHSEHLFSTTRLRNLFLTLLSFCCWNSSLSHTQVWYKFHLILIVSVSAKSILQGSLWFQKTERGGVRVFGLGQMSDVNYLWYMESSANSETAVVLCRLCSHSYRTDFLYRVSVHSHALKKPGYTQKSGCPNQHIHVTGQ